MNSSANMGAPRPQTPQHETPPGQDDDSGDFSALPEQSENQPDRHDPEAKELLRRYLSEIHSYRELGNVALRDLEERLAALTSADAALNEHQNAPLTRSTVAREEDTPTLSERLRELSSYLHEDLTRQQNTRQQAAAFGDVAETVEDEHADVTASEPQLHQLRGTVHKLTPSMPVLDRNWFEERFATMRASIDQLAEQIPTRRIELLEQQFHRLMEKLDARETTRPMAAVEAGLKKLAAYLEDNKHWNEAQDQRVRGVEDRLDRLSRLVAQSHAALSQTAKGLEVIARRTGPELAEKTADLVAERLEPRFERLAPKEPITELSGEVARLSSQSQQFARNTDERLKQLQSCLDESLDRFEAREEEQEPPAKSWLRRSEESVEDQDYDGRMIAAARRAARLADGPARDLHEDGEPLRYQIPYGEFLPEDEERSNSRIGLVVAAVILLLASAAMLYLNLRDRDSYVTSVNVGAASAVADVDASDRRPLSDRLTTGSVRTVVISPEAAPKPIPRRKTADSLFTSVTSDAEIAQPPVEDDQAKKWLLPNAMTTASLSKAAVEGDAEAQFSVGETYLQGGETVTSLPVEERLSKAARWFRRAAEKGHAPSQYRLGTLYELGQGAPKDYTKATAWYERAAESGHVKAMHNLAVLSVVGKGRKPDYVQAAEWFHKAAEHGLRDSQYNLALLYEHGLGVEKDPAQAYRWLTLAARQGDDKADSRRRQIAKHLAPDAIAQQDSETMAWLAEETDAAVNSPAPEPPVKRPNRVDPLAKPRKPAQLMKSSWVPQVSTMNQVVAEAQRLLGKLGYNPGPVDGVFGPRTAAAIRAFERTLGWPTTGKVTETLVAKMAFAL